MPLADDVDIKQLAEQTEGFVGADIEAVCREAVMLTLRKDIDAEEINLEAFEEAMNKVKPDHSAEVEAEESVSYS